ncbi:MAG: hypothetical protein E7166_01750 [Firmicutes bacterium]|nr:hypothetical protein [Bacillota bacterium]
MFKEIVKEFETVYQMLEDGNVLMAVCLIRYTYEEVLYIMETSLDIKLDINIQTRAGYFKEKVCENLTDVLSDSFDKEDINDLYSYLSKITHVTNIKEVISYLVDSKKIKEYIVNEIKYILINIESMFLDFINKKCNNDNSMNNNILLETTYVELLNTLYYAANVSNKEKTLKMYFYGEKNQKYLKEQNELIVEVIKGMNSSKDKIQKSINTVSKELDHQLKESGYMKLANSILNSKK